jgi:hypothetical protein
MSYEEIWKTGTMNEIRNALIDMVLGSSDEKSFVRQRTLAHYDVMNFLEIFFERAEAAERAGAAHQRAVAQRKNITVQQMTPQQKQLVGDAIDKIASDKNRRSYPSIGVLEVVGHI